MHLLSLFSECYQCELIVTGYLYILCREGSPPPQNKNKQKKQPTALQLKGNIENPKIPGLEGFANGTIIFLTKSRLAIKAQPPGKD